MREINSRVGAILSIDNNVVRLLGYGVYEGDFFQEDISSYVLSESELEFFKSLSPEDKIEYQDKHIPSFMKNPRIRLDNGDVVWGRECWWGPEEEIKKRIKNAAKITNVKLVRDSNGTCVGVVEIT